MRSIMSTYIMIYVKLCIHIYKHIYVEAHTHTKHTHLLFFLKFTRPTYAYVCHTDISTHNTLKSSLTNNTSNTTYINTNTINKWFLTNGEVSCRSPGKSFITLHCGIKQVCSVSPFAAVL